MELFEQDKYKNLEEKINVDIIKALPFVIQKIDGRVVIVLGFSSILPAETSEEEIIAAMKRVVIDAKKITDLVIKD